MRNKKLISMLMLSAGFVACTQEEIAENGFVGNENQKDLIEDVVLNVSFNEGVATRAAYAGDKDGNVYRNFYFEPAWDETKETWALSDNTNLVGDMIGYCLAKDGEAITNYPFYIAGYGSAVKEADKQGADYKNKVYVLAEQSNALYNLSLGTDKEAVVATAEGIKASIASVAGKTEKESLDADVLDVRSGIVRTNSGIMTGSYIAYFPYNEQFVDPAGIPAKGKTGLDDLYEVPALTTSRQEALENVAFYDYLFAISRDFTPVNGGKRAGETSITPMTSAITFEITNSATEYKADEAAQEIKRITITGQDNAFILEGSVALDNLNSVQVKKATNLIGVSFEKKTIELAQEDGETLTQKYYYTTIPYMANSTAIGYTFEIYNTKGQVAVIEKPDLSLGLGEAKILKIDMAELKFENATRKIFTEADLKEEIVSGGSIQLMADIMSFDDFDVKDDGSNKIPDLEILGDKILRLYGACTISKNIKMEKGQLQLGQNVTVSGNLNVNELGIASTNKVTGDITAKRITVNNSNNFYQSITADWLALNNLTSSTYTLENADVKELIVGLGANATVNKVVEANVTKSFVKVGTLTNQGTLNVADLTVTTLNNNGTVNVTGSLNATTVNNVAFKKSVSDVSYTAANFNVTGTGQVSASFNNDKKNIANNLVWQSTKAMGMDVTNDGSFTINSNCNITGEVTNNGTFEINKAQSIAGTITNNGTMNIEATTEFEGTLTNNKTVEITNAISGTAGKIDNNAGDAVITVSGTDAYLELTGTKLNINKGKVIVDGGDINGNANIDIKEGSEFVATAAKVNTLDDALSSKSYNAKLTGIIVSATEWPESVTETNKTIYLRDDMTFPAAVTLKGGLVIDGASLVTSTEGKLTVSAITINAGKSLTFAADSNVDVEGTITNNGTYDQEAGAVVWCNQIAGNGEWNKKPKF